MSEDQNDKNHPLVLSAETMIDLIGNTIEMPDDIKLTIANFIVERCNDLVFDAINESGEINVVTVAQMYQLSLYKFLCDNAASITEYTAQQEIINAEPISQYYH